MKINQNIVKINQPVHNHTSVDLPAGHSFPRQREPLVGPAIDVTDELVHVCVVSLRGKFDGFFKCVAASEQTTEAKECSSTKTGNREQ